MRVKRMLLLVFIVLLCASLTACADPPTETGFRVDTTEMTLELTKGTEADFTKLKVEAVFSDETTKTLTEGENGYVLDLGGYQKNTVGEYTVTVTYKTYPAQTFVIKVKEPAAPPIETPSVTGIEIKTAPTKTVYEIGEDLNLNGLAVKKKMSDDSEVSLEATEYIVDSSAYNKAVAGTYAIVVKYKADETKTATFQVTVKAPIPTVTGITVTTTGVKLEYEIGEELDLNGLTVKKQMSDDSEVPLEAAEYTVDSSAYNKAAAGTYTIIVKLNADETKTATFTVTVKAPIPTVTGITVTTTGVKLEYEIGEELDLNGLAVKKKMSDDSEVSLEAAEYTIDSSAYNKAAAGTYTIIVKLNADETKTATFTVTVKAPIPTVTGITVTTTGVKLEYEIGEELDLNGLAVKKKMSDDSEVSLEAAEYTIDSSAYNKAAAGTYTIIVKLNADETKTATFTVTVKEAAVSYRIKTMPRTAFLEGENFNAFGLEVERVDAAGTTTLAADDYIVDYGAYAASAGKYDIFINVIAPANGPKNASAATGAAASLKYTVSVSAVRMNLDGVKRNYREGEPLDTTNLTLSLVDADEKTQPLTEGADYAVDANSYNAWIDAQSAGKGKGKIQIRLKEFPDFPIFYEYYLYSAPLRSAEIDWKRTSTVLPYGYKYQEKPVDGAENVGVFFSGTDVNGKPSNLGRYEYLDPYDGYDIYTVEWDKPLDTTVPGTYHLTLGVRVKAEDELIMLPAIAVTVLAENAPYVVGASSDLYEVELAFGSAIDFTQIPVTLMMSDGTTRQTTLNETDWIIEAQKQSPNYYRFEPKNAYRTRDARFDGNFTIRWTDGANVVTDRYLNMVTDWETRYAIRDDGNNSYEAYLKLNGVYTSTFCFADGKEGRIIIETINGAAYNDQSPYWVSEVEFCFDGTEMTIGFKEESKDNQEGTVDRTLKILPDPNFIRPDTYFELEIDGVKQTPSYSWSDEAVYQGYALEGNANASVTYVIPFAKTALPIRFLLKRDDFRLYYQNNTGNRDSEGMETVYYYQSAESSSAMQIMFSVTSLETGNLMLQGSIRFLMETMVTSMSYALTQEEIDGGDYGLKQDPEQPYFVTVRTASAPSLSKFNIALKDGFRYRFRDHYLGEITTDEQLRWSLESQKSVIYLEVLSDDGVVYEQFNVSFDIMPISTVEPVQNYQGDYYDAEGSERVEWPYITFNGSRLDYFNYITSGMLGGTWTLFDDAYQREVTQGVKFKFFDRDGKEVDLAALNVLSGMYYVRASYSAYAKFVRFDSTTGQEVVSYVPVTRDVTDFFRYSSIEARPSEYIECFSFAPVPENMASDVSRFEHPISAFRTDTVTKESFGVRYKPEYRDTMTMVVEDAGKDKFVAKFYLGDRLVTFLNVTVTREGVVDADTSADFTYQNLSDGNLSFVMFRGGEAYLTLQAGSFFNIVTRNDYAMVTMEASDPDAATGFFGRFKTKQVLLNKVGSYTLRLTVTSTDETAAEDYVLYLRVTEEPPMFTLTAAGQEYRAFLSELLGGAAGDFTMRNDLGTVVLLSEPLKASELGSSYDAAAKTLKLTISAPAPSEIFAIDQNGEPTVPVVSGEEYAYPLMDMAQIAPEFSGMLGTVLVISGGLEGQYPVLIVVNPAL